MMSSNKPLSAIPGVSAVSVCPSCGAKESPRRQYWRANKPEPRKPLSWEEQSQLLEALPTHLQGIVLFMLNTGFREQEACQLQWNEEKILPSLKSSVFKMRLENGFERWVILNDVAQAIIEAQRGRHATHVFVDNGGSPRTRINRLAWKRAVEALGVPELRLQDLRRTFEQRLKKVGVSLQDRQSLLGRSDIDDSNESWERWITIANKVCRPVEQRLSS